jgi:hypothetical protein
MDESVEYTFYGDGRRYTSKNKSLSCTDIKRICNFTPQYQLYAQRKSDFGNAGAKNLYLTDCENADLTGEYVYFYATPTATY